jgi:hypothetical protein
MKGCCLTDFLVFRIRTRLIMDIQTITAYNQDADEITALHSTLIPHKLYQKIHQYFIKIEKCF